MKFYPGKVIDVIRPTTDVSIIRFQAEGFPATWKAGQFISVKIPSGQLKPYSIASSPSEKAFIELCVKHVEAGPVSTYLFNLKKGDSIEVTSPMGIFVVQPPTGDVIFAATGTGISGLKPMIEVLLEQNIPQRIWLFFGSRTGSDIIYQKEFETLAQKHANFRFVPVVSRDPAYKGEQGHVQDVIKKYVDSPKGKEIYICGVLKMVEETIAWAEQFGFEKRAIHFEKYV